MSEETSNLIDRSIADLEALASVFADEIQAVSHRRGALLARSTTEIRQIGSDQSKRRAGWPQKDTHPEPLARAKAFSLDDR
ncbi:MAG: hypothetical protein WDO56_28290 [Gammaproteobacteria bacterium]